MSLALQQGFSCLQHRFNCSSWEDFSSAISREWLLTNGIGGYASSTIIGANTRRYHGLLVAAQPPPLDRHLVLSKIEEEIGVNETFYQLSTNQYRDSVFPAGYRFLTHFSQLYFPTWIYQMPGMVLKKWMFMVHGENTMVVGYQLLSAPHPITLYLRVLATYRNHHHLLRSDAKKFEIILSGDSVELRSGNNGAFLYLATTLGKFHPNAQWYYNFQYVREKERGLDFEEDLFCPGTFSCTLSPKETITLIASTNPIRDISAAQWQDREEQRLLSVTKGLPVSNPDVNRLALAADAFIIKKNNLSVIAGYPWLNDCGRDTLISVPGLFLVTGRIEEAKSLLESYVPNLKNGLLPAGSYELELEELKEINRQVRQTFLGNSARPNHETSLPYASVDTPLWLFYAVYKTFQYSQDRSFVKRMMPALESIIAAYTQGTAFSIAIGSNSLLYAGRPDIPLTWMDAKVGPLVVTPRHGAAVEVNALWYNALKIMETFSPEPAKSHYRARAHQFLQSFAAKFWDEETQSLYDCLTPDGPDRSGRPNQIFALSLPFRLLPEEKEEKILSRITSSFYTPFGLRSLDPEDPNYKGSYQGDRWLRDRALHQGTVWSWLLGPYITALVNVKGRSAEEKIFELLSPILSHLDDAGIGSISEIFWGDFPYQACGCIAKAWNVAEVLRAYIENGTGNNPRMPGYE